MLSSTATPAHAHDAVAVSTILGMRITSSGRSPSLLGRLMYPTVYLETTIIGYLAMQPSGVLRIAANQQTTHEWWETAGTSLMATLSVRSGT